MTTCEHPKRRIANGRDYCVDCNVSYSPFTDAQVAEARAWIADCYWGDLDDASELSDAEVVQGVKNHYDGGWAQFLADALI